MQKNKLPIILLECANSHGGDKFIFKKTIKKFSKNNYKNLHIKFQPFKYDELSTKNYKWYNVYKKLFFKEDYWNKIIKLAKANYKGVWIDISDNYSLKILQIKVLLHLFIVVEVQVELILAVKLEYRPKSVSLQIKIISNNSAL